jgi:CubicO group peptidase (beta-lactamase class C family)
VTATLPESPVGRRLSALLGALDKSDDALRAFAAEACAPAVGDRVLWACWQRLQTGGLEVRQIESADDHNVTALATARHGGWYRLRAAVAADAPHALTELGLDVAMPPRPEHGRSDDDLAGELSRLVDSLVAGDAFSGTVLLARDGETILARAAGLAERSFGAPNRLDTKFLLGSMNKMLTAVAVAQLVERGVLAFDDPLAKHVPDFPNADRLNLHHLLTHTGGTGDFFGKEFIRSPTGRYRSISDYLPLFRDKPLAFEPGSQWSYSNGGYVLLGLVVERATGRSYREHVHASICAPARMADTDLWPLDEVVPNRAVPYTHHTLVFDGPETGWGRRLGPRRIADAFHPIAGSSAGGGFSTVGDLIRFADGLRRGELLSPAMVERVLPPATAGGHGSGFRQFPSHGPRVVGHSGGAPGSSGVLEIYPDRGLALAVLSNYDPPTANRVSTYLRGCVI